MIQEISILGSTGTIGVNTLDVISCHPDKFKVKALTTNSNAELLIEQAQKFKPQYVAVADESKIKEVKSALPDCKILNSATEIAEIETDIIIIAIMGFAALKPTMKAIEQGVTIGLANKESLVCAGELLMEAANKHNTKIIPIDSEHNAIYQIFNSENLDKLKKVVLTASGGPFRHMPLEDLQNVTPEMAVKHPNWNMGQKISVDSATMMNKGLEIIEAKYLFGLKNEQLEAIIHPESIIHALVYFNDGSVIAQAANPDMRVPISYALGQGNRLANNTEFLDLAEIGSLNFEEASLEKFPCLKLTLQAMEEGGSAPIILNSANEVAVDMFLNNQIKFIEIAKVVEEELNKHENKIVSSLDNVFEIDAEIRQKLKAKLAA